MPVPYPKSGLQDATKHGRDGKRHDCARCLLHIQIPKGVIPNASCNQQY